MRIVLKRLKKSFPRTLEARATIRQMLAAHYRHALQSEWIAFFVEWQAESLLKQFLSFPGTRYGRTTIDARMNFSKRFAKKTGVTGVNIDLKAHSIQAGDVTILNDQNAMHCSVGEDGALVYFVFNFDTQYDEDGVFREYHDALKVEMGRKRRASKNSTNRRRFKTSGVLVSIDVYVLTQEDIDLLSNHQQGRQLDGRTRKPKFSLNRNVRKPDLTVTL